jgi:hypothetical protein
MYLSHVRSRARPLTGFLVSGLALISACGFAAAAQETEEPRSAAEPAAATAVPRQKQHPRKNTYMKRKWGIEILYVRQAAAGYMLEFRYKVLDAKKAELLFNRQTKPVLIHARTGAQLIVPTPAKTGALRNSNTPLDDHTYWMFFANPGKLVQPGEHVDIQIGEFLVEKLVVQ